MSYLSIYGENQNIINPATQYVNGLELYGGFRQFQNLGFYGQLTSSSFLYDGVKYQYDWWTAFPFVPSNKQSLPNYQVFFRNFLSYPTLNPGQGLQNGPDIQFTRASSGTYLGSNGYIQTAASGVPRFEYDSTGNPLGLLIEEPATNLAKYSESFTTTPTWGQPPSITANAGTAPDGNNTAALISGNSLNQTITGLTSGSAYVFSIWMRSNTAATININLQSTAQSCNVTTQWKRFYVSATTSTSAAIYVYASTNNIYVWGAQFELGTIPTSYIQTTSSTVTRSADLAYYSSSDVAQYFNQYQGTFVVTGDNYRPAVTSYNASYGDGNFIIYAGAPGNRIDMNVNPDSIGEIVQNSVVIYNPTRLTRSYGDPFNLALSYQVGYGGKFAGSGTTQATGTTAMALYSPVISYINIGSSQISSNYLNGHIAQFGYYNQNLSPILFNSLTV